MTAQPSLRSHAVHPSSTWTAALALVAGLLASPVASATALSWDGTIHSVVRDTSVSKSGVVQTSPISPVPTAQVVAATSGASLTLDSLQIWQDPEMTWFRHDIMQLRQGQPFDEASLNVTMNFMVDTAASYDISGSYSQHGEAGAGGSIEMSIALFDNTDKLTVYQELLTAAGNNISLDTGKGPSGSVMGSSAGALQAGHHYSWTALAFSKADGSGVAAQADGLINLAIITTPGPSPTAGTVPEPGSLALSALSLVSLLLLRRRGG